MSKRVCYVSVIAVMAASIMMLSGCDTMRFAPSESQRQIAWGGAQDARVIAAVGTEAGSDESGRVVDATTAAVSYMGVPANPTITDYPATIAQASADAEARPTISDVWDAADGWTDFAIGAGLAIFTGGSGLGLVKLLQRVRTTSTALREVVQGNEAAKQMLELQGDTAALEAFRAAHGYVQSAPTETLIAAERAQISPTPNMQSPPPPPAKSTPTDQVSLN